MRYRWDNHHVMKHLSHLLAGLLASLFLSAGCHVIAAKLMGLDEADLAQFCDRANAPTVLPSSWA